MSNLEKLTELQNTIGYVAGKVHPVAMLGLLGEAGEVSNECGWIPSHLVNGSERETVEGRIMSFMQALGMFAGSAEEIDGVKKKLRNESDHHIVVVCNNHEDAFNIELADLFYYLNAVAIGRGLTIEDLARISYQKVLRKRATIGPEILGEN